MGEEGGNSPFDSWRQKLINDRIKNLRRVFDPFIDILIKLKVTPNMLTLFGFLLAIAAGFLYSKGYFIAGALLLVASGINDTFDGQLARRANLVSKFGAFFDSTTDRLNESAVLIGIAYYFMYLWDYTFALLTIAFLVFSMMVSYTRARAEGLDIDCKKGIMGRVERVLLLIAASFFPLNIFKYMLILLTILTMATVIQRIMIVKFAIKSKEVVKNG